MMRSGPIRPGASTTWLAATTSWWTIPTGLPRSCLRLRPDAVMAEVQRAVAFDARQEIGFPRQIFAHRALDIAGAFIGLAPLIDRLVGHFSIGRECVSGRLPCSVAAVEPEHGTIEPLLRFRHSKACQGAIFRCQHQRSGDRNLPESGREPCPDREPG